MTNPNFVENIVFSHAAGYNANAKDPLIQVKSRVDAGLKPSIILSKSLSDYEIAGLISYLSNNNQQDVGVNVKMHNSDNIEALFDHYKGLIDTIKKLKNNSRGVFSGNVLTKLGTTVKHDENPDIFHSVIDSDDFISSINTGARNIWHLGRIMNDNGLTLEVDNKPAINYSLFPKGDSKLDPYKRWNGKWSAYPIFIGDLFCNAADIIAYMKFANNFKLSLDMEHLGQGVQWGNIFSLENAVNGVLRVGDLSNIQKNSLRSYGIKELDDNRVLFDYKNLSDSEKKLLDNFNFAVRVGQPMVYGSKLTLAKELEKLSELSNEDIVSITPGFQVSQGIVFPDGRIVIGSHMPGIHENYFPDRDLRENYKDELINIYSVILPFMKKKSIDGVELEIQIDDGVMQRYDGESWTMYANHARNQTVEFFKAVEKKDFDKTKAPFYLI